MSKLQRRIHRALLWLHPAAFRHQFGREMVRDCEDALAARGFAPLLGDAFLSLARQWKERALTGPELEPVIEGHPFLAGQYVMIGRGPSVTALDLARASLLSMLLVLTIGFAASVPNRRVIANTQSARVSHDGGVDTATTSPAGVASSAGRRETAGAPAFLDQTSHGGAPFHGRVRLGRGPGFIGRGFHSTLRGRSPVGTLREVALQWVVISGIVWLVSLFFRRASGIGRKVVLATLGLLGIAASVAFAAVPMPPVHAQILHPTAPLPSYEVATIKPWDGTGFGFPLRSYILGAFNLPPSSVARLIGPEWINKTSFVIQGKPTDSERDAIQKMTSEERGREMRFMQQSLLADRFKLKVHFETREMPVYELVLAKSGSKLKETPNPVNGSADLRSKGQMEELRGAGVPLTAMIGMLMGTADIDGRPVIDKTGLAGSYDVLLDWVPSRLPASLQPGSIIQPGTYGAAPTPDTEGPSLFTALEEQLGVKLVPTKAPVEVIVIDQVEKPSEN